MKVQRLLGLGAGLSCLAACGRAGSEEIATADMTATILVSATPADVATYAGVLLEADGAQVLLSGSDLLTATNEAGEQVVIGPGTDAEDPAWVGVFPYDADGETIVVALERKVDAGALLTEVGIPATFSMTLPEDAMSRAEAIEITWQPATTDPMRLTLSADCLDDSPIVIDAVDPSRGTETLGAEALVADGACAIEVTASRYLEAVPDPGFGGGTAQGEVVRTGVLETKN